VEILHTVYKEISTDFNLNFEHEIDSDGEVVEIVEVFSPISSG
jgi:hypothetical protein